MSNADFHTYMKAAFPRSSSRGARCPDEETLLAWREHRFSPEESSRVRSHVESCASCLSATEDIAAFFDDGASPGREETARAWAVFRSRLEANRPPAALAFRTPRRTWAALAAAASILVITTAALTGIYMKQQASSLVADTRRRISALENENAALRARNTENVPQPQLSASVLDLYPRNAVNRTGREAFSVARASVAPNSSATLILHAPQAKPGTVYSLAINDPSGREAWLGSGLRVRGGTLTLTIPASFLAPGRYTLTLFETSASEGTAAYTLDWVSP